MKNFIFSLLAFALLTLMFSCEALPFNYSSNQSWLIDENDLKDDCANLEIIFVKAEKSGGWDFVEKEAASLAPLYFWKEGCRIVPKEKASYVVGIQLREREFYQDWRTKRSLAAEARIWIREVSELDSEEEVSFYERKIPIAVGRVVTVGDKSFSSSDTTGKMLSKAINKAVKELSTHER